MHGAVAELLFAGRALDQQAVVGGAAFFPTVGVLAVEQHDGPLGRLRPQRRALAFDLLQLGANRSTAVGHLDRAVGNRHGVVVDQHGHAAVLELAVELFSLAEVPAVAGQAADVPNELKLAVAERDHLGADFEVSLVALNLADVLALISEVAVGLGGIGVTAFFILALVLSCDGKRECG